MNNLIQFGEETDNFRSADQEIKPVLKKLLELLEFHHLNSFRIKFLFCKKEMKKAGKVILGKASKFAERDRLLHPYHFLIILSEDFWNNHPEAREALLYHELCHCGVNDNFEPTIIPHDLEEFGSVVRHYGFWLEDIRRFSRQLELFDEDEMGVSGA